MLDSDHYCERLEKLFAGTFARSHITPFSAGVPVTALPSQRIRNNQLHVTVLPENYPASALHEISHWCLAGEARRLVTDLVVVSAGWPYGSAAKGV